MRQYICIYWRRRTQSTFYLRQGPTIYTKLSVLTPRRSKGIQLCLCKFTYENIFLSSGYYCARAVSSLPRAIIMHPMDVACAQNAFWATHFTLRAPNVLLRTSNIHYCPTNVPTIEPPCVCLWFFSYERARNDFRAPIRKYYCGGNKKNCFRYVEINAA